MNLKIVNAIACLLFLSQTVIAQNNNQYAEVISSGGGNSSSNNYTNLSVTGETFVNHSVSNSNTKVDLGYIYMTKLISPPQGVKKNSRIKFLQLFPNPTSGKFKIRLETTSLENLDLKVLNASGKLIYQEQLNQLKGVVDKTISLKNEAKGVYFLRINTDEGEIRRRIVLK